MTSPTFYKSPIDFYYAKNGNYPLLVDEDIDGDTINSLKEWDNHPNKSEIMAEAIKFKHYLRTLKTDNWIQRLLGNKFNEIGRCRGINNIIQTPIFTTRCWNIYEFIDNFQEHAHTNHERKIIDELKNTKFSDNVFCHNALYYKSFVLKDNKLIGIKNWKYAGFYPPEFEDIISKYLDKF